MRNPLPNPLPDTMPLRDALRGLRHALRRGGETLLDVMPLDQLPPPASHLAGAVIREMGELAKGVGEVASGLARIALGGSESTNTAPLQLTARPGAEDAFAQGIYAALRLVLQRLDAPSVYVSETAARMAYMSLLPDQRHGQDADIAAALSLALVDAKVMRGTSAQDAAHIPGKSIEHLAIFAVMLWLQSDRNEDEAALASATDLGLAVAAEADAAMVSRDRAKLSALYAEFAAHV